MPAERPTASVSSGTDPAPIAPASPLRIFFDGGCRVCAWEVKHYLRLDKEGRLGTIDINAPGFDATKYGLDAFRVRRYFHVLTPEGRVIAGVDAFIAIWETLGTPRFRRAARFARHPLPHAALAAGYAVFVRIRPYLPRYSEADCGDGTCER